jgi:hypothetical protein
MQRFRQVPSTYVLLTCILYKNWIQIIIFHQNVEKLVTNTCFIICYFKVTCNFIVKDVWTPLFPGWPPFFHKVELYVENKSRFPVHTTTKLSFHHVYHVRCRLLLRAGSSSKYVHHVFATSSIRRYNLLGRTAFCVVFVRVWRGHYRVGNKLNRFCEMIIFKGNGWTINLFWYFISKRSPFQKISYIWKAYLTLEIVK